MKSGITSVTQSISQSVSLRQSIGRLRDDFCLDFWRNVKLQPLLLQQEFAYVLQMQKCLDTSCVEAPVEEQPYTCTI